MIPKKDVRTVRDLIDLQAEVRPDRGFLFNPETKQGLTFKELQERTRQLCGLFHRRGLVPGDKIAFLMDNGLFTAQLFLGTMYGGFVTVPLNVRAGVAQLAYTLENCDARLVFVGRPYEALLKEVLGHVSRSVEILFADADFGPETGAADAMPDGLPPPGADDAAMLIYTSGSTGQPKGPIHTHKSVLAHGRNSVQAHELTAADRSLLVLPLYHINAECVTLIPTLLSGGSVVLPHGFVVSEFWNWIDDHRCTWTAVVPTIISQLLDWKDPKAASRAEAFARIRFLRSSSAPLSPSLHREFIDKFHLPLIQAMGSSEAGNVFSNPVPPGVNKIGSPGLPWGFEARIVDREGTQLPAGEPGEVWLRGDGMTQGYYKDQAATAAAFDAQGWLHTGDLAYRDEDGYFFVIGRSKELIIKGGVNIAPKQIDEILETHPAVLEAASVGVPDRYVGEDLVAFAVLRDGMRCDELELLSFCENHLGYFKTPTRVYFVADLPKGPSGKVQRLRLVEEAERLAALKEGSGASAMAEGAGADSVDDLPFGKIITEIWTELLAVPQIRPDSNFFALGGQSLQAIQCLSRLREKTQILLSLADFFENATVTELAGLVRRRRAHHAALTSDSAAQSQADLQPIPVRDHRQPCPLSPAQERIWFMEQLNAGEPAYNEAEAVRLKGKLDVEALERAFNIIVERHEILRTTIEARDGRPGMVIHETWPLKFKRINLQPLVASKREAELAQLLITEPRLPYRLDAEPAVRVTIVRLDDEDHALIMMLHHIVCDSASLGILWRELASLYEAARSGEPSPLPPLPIQYGDYAVWQRQPRQQERFAEDIAFWKEQLRGAPAQLDQPSDRPRPAVCSFRGTKRLFAFDAALANDLRRLCRQQQASLFTVFAGAFSTVMHRYTGQDEILVGVPIAARERPELRPLIGFLIDTHVLRTDLSGNPTFRELMGHVQQNVAHVYSHRDVPFDQVVSALKPERNQSCSPLVQVMLNWRDRDDQPQFIGLPGVVTEALLAQPKIAKFDLTLTLTDTGNEILLETEYSTDLFDEERIERLTGHLRTLLEGVVADVEQRVTELPLLTAPERERLLGDWNETAADYPRERCIHELFEAQVARHPDAVAVVFEDQRVTYAALNARANRLAHHLRALGVGPDGRVALCLERSVDMVVGLMAILKAGGAYVPLDPTYPPERLKFMLEDSRPAVVLSHGPARAALQAALPGLVAPPARMDLDAPPARVDLVAPPALVDLDADQARWADASAENPDPRAVGLTSQHLAYVIYTSGSTGMPKGVMNEHRAVLNRLLWMDDAYRLQSQDVVLQKTPFSFDVSVWEFFWPLAVGARLVMLRPGGHKSPDQLVAAIEAQGVTTLHFVPSMLRVFLDGITVGACPSLKHVFTSGEALPSHLLARFQQMFPGLPLHNLYGPTEAAVDVTAWTCAPARAAWGASPPIGRPIWNTRMYILDARLQPVPVGTAGEIHIGGVGVARGYLNRPELTAEKFIASPFVAGDRLYKTGDLGRYLPGGDIEYIGRNDFQVKIRGFRIELGEIEAALSQHAGVHEAVVVARESGDGEKRLVAYYTGPEEIDVEALRAHLGKSQPDYMVPAAFVRLDAFPLSVNGKLDRRALPAPDDGAYARAAYEVPQGQAETALAAIWSELLGVERVSRHDNFFELGGHSLLAVTMIARLRREGLQADVRSVFSAPTLAGLAAATRSDGGDVEIPPNLIPPGSETIMPEMLPLINLSQAEIDDIVSCVEGGAANTQDIYPLAPLQEGLLFHHLMDGEGDTYLTPELFAFDGRRRMEDFVTALQAVIARHDIFRTAVMWDGLSQPAQVVWRRAPLPVEDMTFDPADGDVAEQLRSRFNPGRFRLDVRQAPLMRAFVTHDHVQKRWLLLLLRHHLVIDHATLEVLAREVQAHILGRTEELPAPIPYRNFVAQVRRGSAADHEAFFRGMLGDVDEPTAPFGLSNVQGNGVDIEEARMVLEPELARRLRERARGLGVSAASLFHLAWGLVLSRASGRKDAVFGTVLFGRMQGGAGVDWTPGVFINTLPLRVEIGDEGVEASVRRVHALLAELLRHEHASLAQVQRCSAVPAPAPLFSALLNYRHSRRADGQVSQVAEGVERLGSRGRSNYPVTLSVDDLGDDFSLTAQTYPVVGAERLCGFMRTALEGMVEALEQAPDMAMRSIDMLGSAERQRVIVELNATEADYPRESGIHALFEAQVERTPEMVAAVFGDRTLTYAVLNARANALAHQLIERGVKTNDRVATLLERSIDLIVAQLAILKAGAAYVPLDPQAPPQRQAWIVEDCGASLIITDARTELAFASATPVLRLGDRVDAPANAANPARPGSGLHVAYVMYTSGSTGTPKGVLVPHCAIARLVVNNSYAVIGAEDRVAFAANPAFDASTFELWAPLLNGGTVVVIPHEIVLTPQAFIKTLREERINVLWLTVGLFNQLAEALEPVYAQLKLLITGGDVLDPKIVRKVWSKPGNRPARLLNAYGPTETTTFATTYEIGSSREENGTIPIGRPISNTRTYLLDPHGAPVPLGAVGEIHIGGAGVALGYLNRPELTAERFLSDPFAGEPDARMYRTGDLARYLPDGNLMFLGRNDAQVKLRGFRIELGEIEERLTAHEAVREAVVLALANDGEKRLVAYVVADPDDQLAACLHAYLAACLPDYMVPAAFVRLDALPLTRNGKVDRRALPAPDEATYARASYEAPAGEIETALAEIWREPLGVERISRIDNFFNLGGHSFMALRVISEIHKRLGRYVSVPTFFLNPTIAGLAEELARGHAPQATPQVATLRAGATGLPIYFMGARPEEFRLAQLIGGDRRIFTVDVPILSSWLTAFASSDIQALPTIDQLGVHFGKILAEHAGSTPCVIAGYSLGGKIAFEAARVLQNAGGNVAFVLLLDARAFSWSSYTLAPALESLARIWRSSGTGEDDDAWSLRRLRTALGESWTLVRWLLSRVPDSVNHRVERLKSRWGQVTQRSVPAPLPSGYFDEAGKPIDNLLFNQFALLLGRLWRPRPLDAAGVLIRADNSENNLPGSDPAEGWDGLFTRGLEIVQTAGDHHSMVTEENAVLLARQMNLILDRYEAVQNARGGAVVDEAEPPTTDERQRLEPVFADPERRVA